MFKNKKLYIILKLLKWGLRKQKVFSKILITRRMINAAISVYIFNHTSLHEFKNLKLSVRLQKFIGHKLRVYRLGENLEDFDKNDHGKNEKN